jgi:hypothetical protein
VTPASDKPNFFIVGAPRSGTTAMYEQLRQHPDVFMPHRKEPHFFGSDLTQRLTPLDEPAYRRLFEPGRGVKRRGEASVWYLYSERAPQEIRDYVPEARVIIMLRNPVDMIHSLYTHWLFTGNEDIEDFEAALAAEPDRARGERLPANAIRPEGLRYRHIANFGPHVQRYFDAFGRDAVHVILYDDFRDSQPATYRRLLEFLEVDPDFVPRISVINQSREVRSERLRSLASSRRFRRVMDRLPGPLGHSVRQGLKRMNVRREGRGPMDPDLRRRLTAEFAPDVERLGTILGRDLSAWSDA